MKSIKFLLHQLLASRTAKNSRSHSASVAVLDVIDVDRLKTNGGRKTFLSFMHNLKRWKKFLRVSISKKFIKQQKIA